MEKLSLRERKKIQTRQRILQAAEELVNADGYQAVTIAAICDKAEIAQRTFFAYFTSKEAVFFYAKQLLFEDMATQLHNRPAGKTTFQTLRELLIPVLNDCIPEGGHGLINGYMQIERDNPQLQMHGDHISRLCEDMLRESLARDLQEPIDALGPTLAAASANSALSSIMKKAMEDKSISREETLKTLDETLLFLEAGLVALDKTKK